MVFAIGRSSFLYTVFLRIVCRPRIVAAKTDGNPPLNCVGLKEVVFAIGRSSFLYTVFLRIVCRPRIVAAQSEALEQNKRCPRIVAAASKHGTRTLALRTVTTLALGLFVLYELFPQLIAGLRGCAYY